MDVGMSKPGGDPPGDGRGDDALGSPASQLFKRNPWHGVSLGAEAPDVVTCYIEIVPTDTVKYELDKATGHLKIDRPQKYSSVCPTLYGLLPQTYCGAQVADFGVDPIDGVSPSRSVPPIKPSAGISCEVGGMAVAGRRQLTCCLEPVLGELADSLEQAVARVGRGVVSHDE